MPIQESELQFFSYDFYGCFDMCLLQIYAALQALAPNIGK
jgi:hypothetical protein